MMIQNRNIKISESFLKLHKRLREIAQHKEISGDVIFQLPVTARQLALIAESSEEFIYAAADLSRLGGPELWESYEEWRKEAEFAARHPISELLRRSGYYHGVIDGDAPEPYYLAVWDRIPADQREITTLYLLDGWSFARKRFQIGEHTIEQMAPTELERIGLRLQICKDFFPGEAVDLERLSKFWFLKMVGAQPTGYDYDLEFDHELNEYRYPTVEEDRTRGSTVLKNSGFTNAKPIGKEVSAGYYAPWREISEVPDLDPLSNAVLPLSLFCDRFFGLPLILICEPGWRQIQIQKGFFRESSGIFPDEKPFQIEERDWNNFERWLSVCKSGLAKARSVNSKKSRQLLTACRRYLQATFATGNIFPELDTDYVFIEAPDQDKDWFPHPTRQNRPDAYEDALLHYAFTLEALLSGNNREGIGRRLQTLSALLASRNDNETLAIRSMVKDAYSARSALVHGREIKKKVDPIKLRRLCQRILAIAIYFFSTERDPNLASLVKDLPDSYALQAKVKDIREATFSLLAEVNPLSD